MADDEAVDDGSSGVPRQTRTPATQIIGRIVVVILLAVFVVFAAANAHHVDFSWVTGETRARFDDTGGHVAGGVRLIVLLLASLAIGVLVGALLSWQGARQRHRRRSGNAET